MNDNAPKKTAGYQKVTPATRMLQPSHKGAGATTGFAGWQPSLSKCNKTGPGVLKAIGGGSIMFMSLLAASLLFTAPAHATEAQAQIASAAAQAKRASTATVGGIDAKVTTRAIGSTVLYRIANKGATWAGPVTISIARVGDAQPAISRQLTLKRGQTATFRIKTSVPHPPLELRLQPVWSAKAHVHVYQHKAKGHTLAAVAGQPRRGIIRRASFYVQ